MVEKSKKKPIFDAKLGKKPVFLGDRLLEPKRATRDINDLRATQAARFVRQTADTVQELSYPIHIRAIRNHFCTGVAHCNHPYDRWNRDANGLMHRARISI
jgi:hypothetical protein